ncbi:hypothetical protein [Nannocystis radixulma]|uniref:DUF4397 domain-containing protein n=1 Tax=Nannocystis radixulma TaxID=2995305 RepID=A0ABT5AX66_9BACT|nr:hypothetical protein [Nannocystis radixulma]MDC0666432.1 hypothetical protein [Nannocystis radixulma]
MDSIERPPMLCRKTLHLSLAPILLRLLLSAPLVFACGTNSGSQGTRDPSQAGGAQNDQGNTPTVAIGLLLSAGRAVATITNNGRVDLLFRSKVQILDVSGNHVVPSIEGPDVSVAAGATSPQFTIGIPPLPDGYHEVLLTAEAAIPGSDKAVGASGADYLKVEGGATTVITQAEWYHQSGANVATPASDQHE